MPHRSFAVSQGIMVPRATLWLSLVVTPYVLLRHACSCVISSYATQFILGFGCHFHSHCSRDRGPGVEGGVVPRLLAHNFTCYTYFCMWFNPFLKRKVSWKSLCLYRRSLQLRCSSLSLFWFDKVWTNSGQRHNEAKLWTKVGQDQACICPGYVLVMPRAGDGLQQTMSLKTCFGQCLEDVQVLSKHAIS